MNFPLHHFIVLLLHTLSVEMSTSNATNLDFISENIFREETGRVCPAPNFPRILKWFSAEAKKERIKLEVMPNSISATDADESDGNSGFFVITTIFNPALYKSRYELYHQFSRHMQKTGAQLITVECIFPHLNQTEFQVTSAHNPFHIQIKSKSVYWMKENLINIAVARLPKHAKWVSWLDADIHFHDKHWIELTIQQLKNYTVVQMFETCKSLGPDELEELRVDYSFGYSVVHGKIIDQDRHGEWFPHPGFGWAMSVSAFLGMRGLPVSDILGSSDVHFAYGLINKVSRKLEAKLKCGHVFARNILEESRSLFSKLAELSADGSVTVGYVPVTISHHWHGSRAHRQYQGRWNIFIKHQFNFGEDMIARGDGLLDFLPTKYQMQEDVISYFQTRKEDGSLVHETLDGNRTTIPIP